MVKGHHSQVLTLDTPRDNPPLFTEGTPSAVLLPPLSSLKYLPPLQQREPAKQVPMFKAWAPKERDTNNRPRPKKRMPIAAYPQKSWDNDDHRSTIHRPHQCQPKNRSGFGDPSDRNSPPIEEVPQTTRNHSTSGHRPGRSVSQRGTCHQEAHAKGKDTPKIARKQPSSSVATERGASHRPRCALKSAPLQMAGLFEKARAKGLQDASDPESHPFWGRALRRVRAADSHHARVQDAMDPSKAS